MTGVGIVPGVADCDELRREVIEAKGARNAAQVANAEAEDAGRPAVYSDWDFMELRAAVDQAAMRARAAGCNVDDLVAPNVGDPDSPL